MPQTSKPRDEWHQALSTALWRSPPLCSLSTRPRAAAQADHGSADCRWRPLPPPRNTADKTLFPHPNQSVLVRIDDAEEARRSKAQAAAAVWVAGHKRWKLPYHIAIKLGLRARIEVLEVAGNGS